MEKRIAIDGISRLLCRIHSLLTRYFPGGLLSAGPLPYIAGLLLLQAHTLQAKDITTDSLTVKVYYLRGSSDISRVPGNALSLEHFLHQVDSVCGLSHVAPTGVTVVSSTSPEGSIRLNHALSHARAQSVLDFLSGKSEQFRRIASSVPCTVDERTTGDRLKQTHTSLYPTLRFSEVVLHIRMQTPDTLPVQPQERDTATVNPTDSVPATDPTDHTPPEEAVDGPQLPAVQEDSRVTMRRPVLFIKTNLLYDLLTFVNVAAEVPLGKKFSLEAAYVNPWWHNMRKHRTIELRYLSVTPRYYFGKDSEQYASFFAGFSAGWGKYDLQLTRHGVQGTLWHVSPVFGYTHHIARNWKIEYSVSAGYLQTTYRKYTQKSDTPYGDIKVHDYPWVSHSFKSVLPTSINISLVYTLFRNKVVPYKHDQ